MHQTGDILLHVDMVDAECFPPPPPVLNFDPAPAGKGEVGL
jgi:hypothetical protein